MRTSPFACAMTTISMLASMLSTAAVLLSYLISSVVTTTVLPTTEQVSTEPPEFSIKVLENERSTSSIAIDWVIPKFYQDKVKNFEVQGKKRNSSAIISSTALTSEHRSYIIEDLRTNTDYEVCVFVTVVDIDGVNGPVEYEDCKYLSTIAIMRVGSIIGLIVALGYILLMILLGYLCWRYHKSKILAEQAKKEEDEENENKDVAEKQPIMYLAPPVPGQRSSIEEDDIPYITPPVDKLSPADRDSYYQGTHV